MSFIFITTSHRGKALIPLAHELSLKWGVPYLPGHPLPQQGIGLILRRDGVALYVHPHPPQLWHPGFIEARWRQRDTDPLLRAFKNELSGSLIIDGTLGLGHDALLLAKSDARIFAIEKNPLIAYYTRRGLDHYDPSSARFIQIRCGTLEELTRARIVQEDPRSPQISSTLDDWSMRPDFIYLDPMFDRPSKSHTLSVLRAGEKVDTLNATPTQGSSHASTPDEVSRFSPQTLSQSLDLAQRSVLLKLRLGEPPPPPPLPVRQEVFQSNRVKVVRWTKV